MCECKLCVRAHHHHGDSKMLCARVLRVRENLQRLRNRDIWPSTLGHSKLEPAFWRLVNVLRGIGVVLEAFYDLLAPNWLYTQRNREHVCDVITVKLCEMSKSADRTSFNSFSTRRRMYLCTWLCLDVLTVWDFEWRSPELSEYKSWIGSVWKMEQARDVLAHVYTVKISLYDAIRKEFPFKARPHKLLCKN